eukprot:comp9422_c0_seq1/m.10899 comp9422_c0_seq1/g.10899  ORF comp9422_c0_seq1/g.10899 comp9422_c0_seq1/m.10899 type:complete len:391 (-) comp9422_c0_seq1:315-1487(-)
MRDNLDLRPLLERHGARAAARRPGFHGFGRHDRRAHKRGLEHTGRNAGGCRRACASIRGRGGACGGLLLRKLELLARGNRASPAGSCLHVLACGRIQGVGALACLDDFVLEYANLPRVGLRYRIDHNASNLALLVERQLLEDIEELFEPKLAHHIAAQIQGLQARANQSLGKQLDAAVANVALAQTQCDQRCVGIRRGHESFGRRTAQGETECLEGFEIDLGRADVQRLEGSVANQCTCQGLDSLGAVVSNRVFRKHQSQQRGVCLERVCDQRDAIVAQVVVLEIERNDGAVVGKQPRNAFCAVVLVNAAVCKRQHSDTIVADQTRHNHIEPKTVQVVVADRQNLERAARLRQCRRQRRNDRLFHRVSSNVQRGDISLADPFEQFLARRV